MTSEFVKVRDAIEAFVDHLWNDKGVQASVQTTEAAGLSVAKQALTAGALAALAAKSGGGNASDIEKAAESAALSSAKTVGLSIGTDTAEKIVSTITASLHTSDAAAPPTQ